MWMYRQNTGDLSLNGISKGVGYSGHGPGFDNPSNESVKAVGPIPVGDYIIGPFQDEHPVLGPCIAPLIPNENNQMFGRSGFFIHGDNQKVNHTASDGCIVLNLTLRQLIRSSNDFQLQVTV